MTQEKDEERPGAAKPAPASERIAKRLARAGLCSRREAERWIAAGRVAVDGTVLTSPAVTVTESSIISVDGKPVGEPERARLWRYNKPRGPVCTAKDAKGRPSIFDTWPKELPRALCAGPLDSFAEGLILMTNDGGLKRHLELPATGWIRRYRARVFGPVDEEKLKALSKGARIGGLSYGPIEASIERRGKSNSWIVIGLHEGKGREARRVLEHLKLSVTRLIRISYGPFQLGNLPEGAVAEVPGKVIREQIGGVAAKAAAGAKKGGRGQR